MPWASTRTAVPSVAFEALFTTAAPSPLDDEVVFAGAAACEEEPELLELLPHAANVSDAASGRARNLRAERIGDSFGQGNEKMKRRCTEVACPIRLHAVRLLSPDRHRGAGIRPGQRTSEALFAEGSAATQIRRARRGRRARPR